MEVSLWCSLVGEEWCYTRHIPSSTAVSVEIGNNNLVISFIMEEM